MNDYIPNIRRHPQRSTSHTQMDGLINGLINDLINGMINTLINGMVNDLMNTLINGLINDKKECTGRAQ